MRTLLRYVLLSFSIAALTTTIANAATDELPAKPILTNVTASPTLDIIPKSYVTIGTNDFKKSIASLLMATADILLRPVNKNYSLLNWTNNDRGSEQTIESYSRIGHFGKWVKDRSDTTTCLNSRAKALVRDSIGPIVYSTENPCSVDKGVWLDPYGGRTLTDAKAEVQIDHMVPLKNAYISGAHKWDYKARCLYGNYLGYNFHLLSVDGLENNKKSDKAPDQYMPSEKKYTCTYLKNWLTVKALWNLEMTLTEADAIKKLILSEGCTVSDFQISDTEVQKQRKFAFENADLCTYAPPTE